ncbi:citrate lyase subunit alpha / citrate CoA-transferase [Caloramator quimbayensis]|uniref:Citrate lyase alpha chain n=1 Tax=Caloramator quimbayensis TaxID=1147123 RepID=A0A1T4XLC3_9CLOT|nr:citrate lyase subunit alpha [Caloramator quimbayensis]SKA90360.1 citrate lyase subunit alpha / citrate CoA-transferase [Caloramator quimbayensis]
MINAALREIPEYIKGYGKVKPFEGAFKNINKAQKANVSLNCKSSNDDKVVSSIEEVLKKCGIRDGMTLSFHHHLRNGDYVLNMVMEEVARLGIKDIKVAASSIFPIHEPLVELIKSGVVTGIYTNYMSGPVAQAVSLGYLKYPAIMHTHGGRARAIESGDLHIDIAFIASPACDTYGNINGVEGRAACGSLGYAIPDAMYADRVVAITDNLLPYPLCPIEISQEYVDYIVAVEEIGDPKGIVSGTTKITKDPVGLKIAKLASSLIEESGLLKDGFSFQTGAGGTTLAVAAYVKEIMKRKNIKGSFAAGGITGYIVEMLEEGLFTSLFDVQCFDLKAVQSYRDNKNHQGMSASMYGNPHNKGAVVNMLDVMILGATEVDTDFNVNVTTGSDGFIMGGSGGHSDTAAGAKLSIVTTQLIKGRLPIVADRVTTVTTPGETIDAIVTERGIAINPKRKDLIEKLKGSKLPIMSIEELKNLAVKITGIPQRYENNGKIVGVVEYRDGTVIDVIRQVQ